MIQPFNETAFSAYAVTPETLWRTAHAWEAAGHDDHAEWLSQMAVDLLDIRALPEVHHPYEIRRSSDDFPF